MVGTAPTTPPPTPTPLPPASPPSNARPPRRRWKQSAPTSPEVAHAGLAVGAARRAARIPTTVLAREAGLSRSWVNALEVGAMGLTPSSALRLYAAMGRLVAARLTEIVPASRVVADAQA